MRYILILPLLLSALWCKSSHIDLSDPILYKEEGKSFAVFNISWRNSWHNDRNHDAVWIFFKFLRERSGYVHPLVAQDGHTVTANHGSSNPDLTFEVPEDRSGLFLYPSSNFRGNIDVTVKVFLDAESFEKVQTSRAYFEVYALEMVEIPKGGLFIGDSDTASLAFGAMYRSDANGDPKGQFEIKSEDQTINIGQEAGDLYYRNPTQYEGDQKGTIPAEFPKGVSPFYIMKYEPTQGQYVDFLNTLADYQSQNRANFGGKHYYSYGGSIGIKDGKYFAEHPNAACNYMSWDDAMAYADWAALRPMTEFEFTKAARGTGKAQAKEYPWGTASKALLQRRTNNARELVMLNGWDESKLTDQNKEVFGASYYWVMDLAGSLWERVISIGHEKGRAFTGTHGDGKITWYGFATNEDWPKGIEETGGFGFRGGGFYGYGREYGEFNPFSPIAYRRFGGWSGGNRTEAYGARFVRSIDQ